MTPLTPLNPAHFSESASLSNSHYQIVFLRISGKIIKGAVAKFPGQSLAKQANSTE
jgi:hypothetical protein